MFTGLFYSCILNMNGRSLHTMSFRRVHASPCLDNRWTRIGFTGPKGFPFSKVPKSFRTRKAIAKSRTLWWLQRCFIHVFLIRREVSFRTRSCRCAHLSVVRYRLTTNGFFFYCPETFPGLSRNGPPNKKTIFQNVIADLIALVT